MHKIDGSSAIAGAHHDGDALVIEFKSGRVYRYPTAGAEHADALHQAESAGRYFNKHIRPHHQHEAHNG